MKTERTSYERIYAAVRKIPRGRVTTYGSIARLAGLPRQARLVGGVDDDALDGSLRAAHLRGDVNGVGSVRRIKGGRDERIEEDYGRAAARQRRVWYRVD